MGFLAWWILNGETCVHSWHDGHTGLQAITNQTKSSELEVDQICAAFGVLLVWKFAADLISYVNCFLSWMKQRIKKLILEQLKELLCKCILQSGKYWHYLNNPGTKTNVMAPRCAPPASPASPVSASHSSYCDILDEFLTAWLLTSWTVTWNKWRHKEETQGSGLREVGCWAVKLAGCKIALQTCTSFSVCWWALNTQSLIHRHLYSLAFLPHFVPLLLSLFWGASIFV